MTIKLYTILLFLTFNLCISNAVEAQIVLYMEIMTEEKPIKYYKGDWLSFKSSDFPDDWRNIRIERILDEESIILYDGGMIEVKDIIKIRRTRKWVDPISIALQTFGTVWLVYGAIAHFATDNYEFGTDTGVIGGGALLSGFILKKAFKFKKYKIGSKVRLKTLDISWPEPRG